MVSLSTSKILRRLGQCLATIALGALVIVAASRVPGDSNPGTAQVSASAHRADTVLGEIVVQLRSGSDETDAQRVAASAGGKLASINEDTGMAVISLPPGRAADKIADIEKDSAVLEAGQNYIAEAAQVPNDPAFASQWHLQAGDGGIDAEGAWDIATNGGSGVTVAVIDTGLAYEYANDAQGRSFAPSPEFSPPHIVDPWDFTENDEDANDDNGHGTHVASLIGGATGNGYGSAGIASNASIMPLKALSWDGTGKASDVIDAIYYAVNHHASIINMSLAFPGSGAADADGYYCGEIAGLNTALDYAQAHDITVIAAAGNGGSRVACPAAYPSVIAVGATRLDGTVTGYSNGGNPLDIVAPGGDPAQDLNNDGKADGIIQNTFCQNPQLLHNTLDYTQFCDQALAGTSQAAAAVTGIAALLLGQSPHLTPHDIRNLLEGTARDSGPSGWDQAYGWGLVDARAAVESLNAGTIPPDQDHGQSGPEAPGANSPESYPPSVQSLDLSFVRVIDGNTIEFWNGSDWGVRYLGVDVPPGNTECGREATAKNWDLTGAGVHLEQEPPYDLDANGLRLYNAFTADGALVGEELIKAGLARASNEDSQYKARYLAAQADAEAAGRGCLWGANSASLQEPSLDGPVVPNMDPQAAAIPPVTGFEEDVIATGLDNPTNFDFTPDGRIFISEKAGLVLVYKNGALLPTPLIDLRSQVNDYWDHGLLSVAVDPNFAANGYVYLLYTYENNPGDYYGFKTGRLIRVTVSGDTASLATAVTLLGTTIGTSCNDYPDGTDCIPSDSPSHSVGGIAFGPDGKMYVTLGDGAHFNYVDDNATRAQNLDLLSGKVLRINTNGTAPSDNPFWNGSATSNRSKVWAYGVRNAFRLNVRPSTGTVYLGDVGWDTWEEADIVRKGGNLGWPCYEGTPKQTGYGGYAVCTQLWAQGASAVIAPAYSWNHNGSGAAAVGGDFSSFYPQPYKDAFFFGDYVRGWLKYMQVDANDNVISINDFAENGADGPVSMQTAANGDIYYLAINTGELRQLHSTTGNRNPVAAATATPTNGHAPLAVQFNGSGSSDPDGDPLTYSWNFGDGGTSTQTNPSHTYTVNNVYTAVLTVRDNRSGVATASIVITVGNTQPTPVISAPSPGDHYKTGDVIQFAGSATDPEDPSVPASSLSWTIILHHNTHNHPFLNLTGDHGMFTVPDHGDESWFEIRLTAVDSGGLSATTAVNLTPQELQLTLASDPASGPVINYDGQPLTTPAVITTIANSVRTVTAQSPQFSGDQQYTFDSWSDGGAAQHDINVGTTSHTLTATFTASTVQPVTFDDLAGVNQPMTGQYPAGVINWGTNTWLHSEPYGLLDTKNLTFNGPGITSASFSFVSPRLLIQLDAYNGSLSPATVSLSCPGQLTKQEVLAPATMMSIDTGWANPCTTVTISSNTGWDTNFDNLIIGAGGPDTTPPVISNVTASDLTASSGTVTWTTDESATSRVEYGLTTAYGTLTAPDSNLMIAHSVSLSGLAASTTYHYRVISADGSSNSTTSGDFTFTTPAPGPVQQTVTFDDLAGQNAPLTGQYPAGVISWGANGDWWHSEPFGSMTTKSVTYNGPGITAATLTFVAAQRLVSVQVYNGGTASTTVTLSCPGQSNKVQAVGVNSLVTMNTGWTATCASATIASTNGWDTNFDNLVIQSGASDTTPPVISAVTATNITTSSATITWNTDEPASSRVEYGLTASYGTLTTLDSNLVTSHSVVLNGLATSTTYHYRVISADAAANSTTSGDFTLITAADTTPPTISNVNATNVTNAAATIGWTTNEASSSRVEYGLTTSYGTLTTLNPALVTSHSVGLSGLSASTTYHYRVISTDAATNTATSGDFTFTTAAAPDTTPPVISSVQSTNITTSGVTITWTTDEPATSRVEYGTTTSYGAFSALDSSLVTSHSVNLSGLAVSTPYHFRVISADAANNTATSGDFTFTTAADTAPPLISAVTATNLAATTATVAWTTNEPATSRVEYGLTASYGALTALDSSLVTSHTVNLSGLTASTTYHYRVISTDAANNTATSGDFTFITASSTPPPQTLTFDDVAGQNAPLNGQYPTGIIDWGSTNVWWHSEPFGQLATKSLTFNGGGLTSATFTFLTPQTVVSVQAFNGGAGSTTVTLSCPGQANKVQPVASNTLATITTGWIATTPCSTVTIASTNGWDTNFDNLVIQGTGPDSTPPVIANVSAGNFSSTGAAITWTTNEPASSRVEYGLTTSYGSLTALDSSLVTSHTVNMSGLAASTTYHYRVISADVSGNSATSGDFTFTTLSASTQTIIFDDAAGQDVVLTGQYPTGVINWGSNGNWWLSAPFGQLTTKNVTFNGGALTGASFTFVTPRRLVSLQAFNGGVLGTTVSISCAGQATKDQYVAPNTLASITTDWTATCTSVTISSTNGWDTNYDNLVISSS